MSERWSMDHDAQLAQRQWGEEYVVYHAQSGDTHLFDELGMAILALLRHHTVSTDDLLQQLADKTGASLNRGELLEVLDTLSRQGLIRKHS